MPSFWNFFFDRYDPRELWRQHCDMMHHTCGYVSINIPEVEKVNNCYNALSNDHPRYEVGRFQTPQVPYIQIQE